MNLAIFPLPIYLLPGGITRLRIFEQRYLKMVKQAVSGDGFVISLVQKDEEQQISNWGSHVSIIDFQSGVDGLLYIDVQCQAIVNIDHAGVDDDQLMHAEITPTQHWPIQQLTDRSQLLAEQLHKFFIENPSYASLYPDPQFDSAVWVCSRWLELLPIDYDKKCCFIEADSFAAAINFLSEVIIEPNEEKTDLFAD